MKLPAGYGSVIKLGGKRRKPYAVRITTGRELCEDGVVRQKYKYLEYFEKRKDAMVYLSNYNAGARVLEHKAAYDIPTFSEIYEKWFEQRTSRKQLAQGTIDLYKYAYRNLADLHDLKFQNIRLEDLENCVSKYKGMSAGVTSPIMTVLHGMYKYALKYEIVEKDYSQLLEIEHAEAPGNAHTPFTESEIDYLWEHKNDKNVYVALIMIYTGLRMSEFRLLETANIHLPERYMTGGVKTAAGRNRIIPVSEKIAPLIEAHYNPESKYFYPSRRGEALSVAGFKKKWAALMEDLGMSHKTHDARHTCATMMEKANIDLLHRKIILGHAVKDMTENVYTHISTADLIDDINKL